VLVLSAGESETDVETVRNSLDEHGYDARIAASLPNVEDRSLEQQRAIYMMLSKFSILVDRDPSHRLSEYETAKAHNNVLARLVPAGTERQSTHLIGGHEDTDVDHIREFEFEDDPTEVLDDAISWAESVIERRRSRDRFPWRGN